MKYIRNEIITIFLLFLAVVVPFTAESASEAAEKGIDNRILILKIKKNASLYELIQAEGYIINDEDVVRFLTHFSELNPDLRGISLLKAGALVRVPVKHLRKKEVEIEKNRTSSSYPKYHPRKKEPVLSMDAVVMADYAQLMMNIKKLFLSLGERVSVEQSGFKYLPLGEKSEVLFDTSLFPVVLVGEKKAFVLDSVGSFPEEIKNLVEISWPEYKVISADRNYGLRGLVSALLRESGYIYEDSGKILSGGRLQVEYRSDFLVHGKRDGNTEPDISMISILNKDEIITPPEVVSWFLRHDIRIIELAESEKKYFSRNKGQIIRIPGTAGSHSLVREILSASGYPYSSNEKIVIGSRKDIKYSIWADLLVDLGHKKKVIDFSGLSDNDGKYIRKMGLDIAIIEPWENRREIIKKIISLVQLNYSDNPRNNSMFLTPRNTRYRIMAPGFAVKTLRGQLFITDIEMDSDLTKGILNEGISIITF